jgi:hypothetical protein
MLPASGVAQLPLWALGRLEPKGPGIAFFFRLCDTEGIVWNVLGGQASWFSGGVVRPAWDGIGVVRGACSHPGCCRTGGPWGIPSQICRNSSLRK